MRPAPSHVPKLKDLLHEAHIQLHYQDLTVLRDVYQVMAHAVEMGSCPTQDKVKVANLWRIVLGPMLHMPADWVYSSGNPPHAPTSADTML